jgi:hypothetical protein
MFVQAFGFTLTIHLASRCLTFLLELIRMSCGQVEKQESRIRTSPVERVKARELVCTGTEVEAERGLLEWFESG